MKFPSFTSSNDSVLSWTDSRSSFFHISWLQSSGLLPSFSLASMWPESILFWFWKGNLEVSTVLYRSTNYVQIQDSISFLGGLTCRPERLGHMWQAVQSVTLSCLRGLLLPLATWYVMMIALASHGAALVPCTLFQKQQMASQCATPCGRVCIVARCSSCEPCNVG